ncbi:MAG: hypothetical protein J5875_12815 [Paludibacteraceae bacterium]|nr:hypothetical protein [Paludibacteraceae bacterium]
MRKITSLLVVSALAVSSVSAQNNTSSPYSRYGYGELVEPGFGYSKSLGGLSAGIRNYNHINSANPASYTAIDTLGFRFEFGASIKCSKFTDNNNLTTKSWDQNLEYLALQLPVTKWMGFSAGLQPFSFVGYQFGGKSVTPSTISTDSLVVYTNYAGVGDITQLYLGLGVEPFKNFNLGMNVYYNFGTVSHASQVAFANSLYHSTLQKNEISVHDWNVGFGAQYDYQLNEKRNLTVGLTFDLPSKMKASAEKEVVTANVDTVTLNFDNSFGLPLSFGAGFAYDINESWMIGADYKFQKWSDVEYFGEKVFNDRQRFACGAELLPDRLSKKFFKRMSYRVGANFSNSYFDVNENEFNQLAFSAGFGIPLRRVANPTYLNLGFEYGRAGKKSDDMILEQYFKLSLNLSVNERWFVKRKFE